MHDIFIVIFFSIFHFFFEISNFQVRINHEYFKFTKNYLLSKGVEGFMPFYIFILFRPKNDPEIFPWMFYSPKNVPLISLSYDNPFHERASYWKAWCLFPKIDIFPFASLFLFRFSLVFAFLPSRQYFPVSHILPRFITRKYYFYRMIISIFEQFLRYFIRKFPETPLKWLTTHRRPVKCSRRPKKSPRWVGNSNIEKLIIFGKRYQKLWPFRRNLPRIY